MITDFLQVNIDKKKFENEYIKQLEQKIKEQQREIEELRIKENVISVVQINKKVLHPKMNYKKMEEQIMKLKNEEIEALAVLDTKLELYGEGEPCFTYEQLDNLSKLIEKLLDTIEQQEKDIEERNNFIEQLEKRIKEEKIWTV